MEKNILVILVSCLSIYFASAAFAQEEKALERNSPATMADFIQEIAFLKQRIEDLQVLSQNKNMVLFAGEEKETQSIHRVHGWKVGMGKHMTMHMTISIQQEFYAVFGKNLIVSQFDCFLRKTIIKAVFQMAETIQHYYDDGI